MKRAGWVALGLLAALGAAVVACDLNPQPLPPIVDDDRSKENGDGTGAGSSGGFEQAPPADPSPSTGASGDAAATDGGTPDASADGGPDAG